MAKDVGGPGLTTFGWLLLGGVAAALLSNKERREKVLNTVKGFTGRFGFAAVPTDSLAQS